MTSEEKMSYSFRKYQYIPLDDGTVEITGYYGKTEDLVIPSMMHGMKVSKIGNSGDHPILCVNLESSV